MNDVNTHEPALRRRFPLTLTALAGSAIAIPLYIAATTTTGADAEEATSAPTAGATARDAAPTESSEKVSVEAAPEAPPADSPTSTIERREMAAPSEAPSVAAAPPADFAPSGAAAPMKRSRDAKSKGSFGEGAAAGPGMAGLGRGGGGLLAEAPKDEDAGYDAQLSAGQLTAGLLDDLQSTTLLDELRAKATLLDGGIAQAIPSHKAKGAAPKDGSVAPVLEVGFVIDTTGSMGDELQYLKTEIRSIAQEIGREYPNVDQRYGLVVYRDTTDEYLVRHHDFESLDNFVDHLGSYSAGGGGDFPEALDAGMRAASQLQWSGETSAKLVFVVADAPAHTEGYENYVQATGSLAIKGVSVYPVASSGVEPICEYLMRWAARTTGGKYLFLTDHSGIGGSHADPHADEYELKSLREHMLDVIGDELRSGPAQPGALVGSNGEAQFDVHVTVDHGQPTWMDRHGAFMMILGGVFLLGFAGDMALSSARRRR